MAWYIYLEEGDTIIEHGGGYNHICHFKFNKTQKVEIVAFSNTANVVDSGITETIFEWITE